MTSPRLRAQPDEHLVRLVGETRLRPDGDTEFVVVASPNVAALIQAAMKAQGTTFPEHMVKLIDQALRGVRDELQAADDAATKH